MQKVKSHIKNLKHLLWVWIVFFALSPCVVKEAIFNIVDIEYNQPLNKSKSTAPTKTCQYSQNDIQKYSVAKQSNIAKHTEAEKLTVNVLLVIRCIGLNTSFSKTTSGNSPPKYILYKRLKLDVA